MFREPLEPGLVVSGEIRDPDALGDALKRFFELHKLPKRGVRLGVSNNRIGVRIFEIDGVADEQQLENAIRFRAEEVLPIPLDEAVLDYAVLDEREREDGTTWKRILLVVAYREVVDRYLQACRRAGLQVVGIDLEAFALLRSLEAPAAREETSGGLVAVAIGHDRTTIAVSTGLHCEFARVLDWGGWSLNVAIARELDRAPSEVESIKRHLSFAHTTEVDGLTPEQVAKSRDGIQRSLAAFSRELISSLQFYQAQPGALGIGEVVLTGGTAHMDGFVDAVGEAIGVPVRLGDPFRRVKVGPNVAMTDSTARSRSRSAWESRTRCARSTCYPAISSASVPTAAERPSSSPRAELPPSLRSPSSSSCPRRAPSPTSARSSSPSRRRSRVSRQRVSPPWPPGRSHRSGPTVSQLSPRPCRRACPSIVSSASSHMSSRKTRGLRDSRRRRRPPLRRPVLPPGPRRRLPRFPT